MKKRIIYTFILSIGTLLLPLQILAQDSNANVSESTSQINWILLCIAFVLLIPMFITGKTFLYALKQNLKKKKEESSTVKKISILLLMMLAGHASQAQTFNASDLDSDLLSWIITGVICIEAVLIIVFSNFTINLLKPEVKEEEHSYTEAPEGGLAKIWNKMNSFKPLSEEGQIDTGHDYDGIRELNNITPPWFITGFALTILFGVVYMYRYHVAKAAPLQEEEFAIEMANAEKAKSKLLLSKANNIDESNVVMLTGADIEAGKKLFGTTCSACHGPTGGSMAGGVGPNLTDDYWIHGGSIQDIFKSIKYGWPDKGMIAWESNFSPKQMAQLASYIKSLKGSNPPGAKEAQGELYTENAKAETPANTDSTNK